MPVIKDFDNGHTPETLLLILIISHSSSYSICLLLGFTVAVDKLPVS